MTRLAMVGTQEPIEEIQQHLETVEPGQPATFTAACSVGDCIRQGDLYIIIVASVPKGYKKIKRPTDMDRQLVPGKTEGARHCLDSFEGVKLFRPEEWSEESLDGPCLIVTEERKILHRKESADSQSTIGHGTVTLVPGFTYVCSYQREYDKELEKESRVRD